MMKMSGVCIMKWFLTLNADYNLTFYLIFHWFYYRHRLLIFNSAFCYFTFIVAAYPRLYLYIFITFSPS